MRGPGGLGRVFSTSKAEKLDFCVPIWPFINRPARYEATMLAFIFLTATTLVLIAVSGARAEENPLLHDCRVALEIGNYEQAIVVCGLAIDQAPTLEDKLHANAMLMRAQSAEAEEELRPPEPDDRMVVDPELYRRLP
jgi:hypothetical protein